MANFATEVAQISSKWAILVKFQQKLKYLSRILTDLHQTFRTGLVFPSWSKWVQGVLCYYQNWWKLKYLSGISIDLHWQFYLNFSTFLNCFRPKWLKMTHNGKFCQEKWLRLAQNGQFWSFCMFFHLFPQNEAEIDSEWPISPDSELFSSFATKVSHFWRNRKNFLSVGVGGGLHWHIFWVFRLFKSFHTEVAQNGPQWQILPLKWLRLA